MRPTDFLIGEVEQIIEHNIVTHASSTGASGQAETPEGLPLKTGTRCGVLRGGSAR